MLENPLNSGQAARVARATRASAVDTAARADALRGELSRPARRGALGFDLIGAERSGEADRNARQLARRIRAHLDRGAVVVRFTDNRYSMISVRRDPGPRYHVRLHHMFWDTEPMVVRALARYIGQNDRDASRLLGEFIEGATERIRPARRASAITLETRGRHHDLHRVFDDLNARYFDGAIDARITWGQKLGVARRRNSIKMGSYSIEDRLIRMHRALDRPFVPRFFVEWIVYHEMLHQVHDAEVVGGRRCFHTRAFVADEAGFEHYAAARRWERENLDRLLTY